MKYRAMLTLGGALAAANVSAAEKTIFECDVHHSARLNGIHLEGAGVSPKIGKPDDPGRIFAIEITSPEPLSECDKACKLKQTVREVPSNRPRPKGPDLCESGGNQVLMHSHTAQAAPDAFTVDFRSSKDLGFLRLVGPFDQGQTFHFWQSGFDYPGCEDTRLFVRNGKCRRRD